MTSASIENWLVIAGAVGAAWFLVRGGGGTAITTLEKAGRVMANEIADLQREGREKDKRIAELEAKTDVSLATASAIAPLLERGENYERRAEERHLVMLGLLQLIADRLGPEPT